VLRALALQDVALQPEAIAEWNRQTWDDRGVGSGAAISREYDGDFVPDFYVGDYNAQNGNGFAGVYSGLDGSLIHGWAGGPLDGTGPGREAGDVNHDGRIDLAVGSYTASDGAPSAGRVDVRSGRTGNALRTITSTTEGENLGFDVVGVGDVNRDGRLDLLISAAEGDTVYLVAG